MWMKSSKTFNAAFICIVKHLLWLKQLSPLRIRAQRFHISNIRIKHLNLLYNVGRYRHVVIVHGILQFYDLNREIVLSRDFTKSRKNRETMINCWCWEERWGLVGDKGVRLSFQMWLNKSIMLSQQLAQKLTPREPE